MNNRMRSRWKKIACPIPRATAWRWGDCTVFIAQEPVKGDPWPLSWHLSISNPYRYPSWDEIKSARYELIPDDVTMAMLLPPSGEFVNIHQNCFHLHQIVGESHLIGVAI